MSYPNAVKVSGSNFGSMLTATAFAVSATLSAPAVAHQAPVPEVAYTPTDQSFILLPKGETVGGVANYRTVSFTSAFDRLGDGISHRNAFLILHDQAFEATGSQNDLSSSNAIQFYDHLPASVKSDTLWDIISLAALTDVPFPAIEKLEDMVTVDFSTPGQLLSLMIDDDICQLSAFTKQKELKMTYFFEAAGSKDALNEVVWAQLRDFKRHSRV